MMVMVMMVSAQGGQRNQLQCLLPDQQGETGPVGTFWKMGDSNAHSFIIRSSVYLQPSVNQKLSVSHFSNKTP